ncbi:MAG: hypothetical protein AAF721_29670 [Myxococcota bacterium]
MMDPASLCLLASESIPVIDIDGTLFIQGGLFIALALVLHPLLFKPWLAAQARRAEAIDGALAKAKTLLQDADALVGDYEKGLDDARSNAIDERAGRRRGVEAEQAAKVAETRQGAMKTLDEDRARIAAEAEAARSGLATEVGNLANTIAARLLGRAS